MPQHKLAALTFDAMEIDQDDLSRWSKGVIDGLQRSLRKLEMVVRVADENQIDGVPGQLGRKLMALNCLDVLELVFFASFLDVAQKGWGDIHGDDLPLFPDLGSEPTSKQSGAGANVSDYHSRLDLAGGDDFLGVGGNLSAFALELLEKVLEVRVFKRLVDSGPN